MLDLESEEFGVRTDEQQSNTDDDSSMIGVQDFKAQIVLRLHNTPAEVRVDEVCVDLHLQPVVYLWTFDDRH